MFASTLRKDLVITEALKPTGKQLKKLLIKLHNLREFFLQAKCNKLKFFNHESSSREAYQSIGYLLLPLVTVKQFLILIFFLQQKGFRKLFG